jgi:hypothetical protein
VVRLRYSTNTASPALAAAALKGIYIFHYGGFVYSHISHCWGICIVPFRCRMVMAIICDIYPGLLLIVRYKELLYR